MALTAAGLDGGLACCSKTIARGGWSAGGVGAMVATTRQHCPQLAVLAVLQPSADPSLQSSMRGCVTLPAAYEPTPCVGAGGWQSCGSTHTATRSWGGRGGGIAGRGVLQARKAMQVSTGQVVPWVVMVRAATRTCIWSPTHPHSNVVECDRIRIRPATQNNGQAAARPCSRTPPPPGRAHGGGRARRERAPGGWQGGWAHDIRHRCLTFVSADRGI